MAIVRDLVGVTDKEGGVVVSILGNEGRIVQAWENVRGGMRFFCRVLRAFRRMDAEE